MKRINRLSAIILSAAALSLTSCGAMLTTETYSPAPGYYGAGLSTDWYPPLAGAPLVSPVYWGGQLYPGSVLPPVAPTRPGVAVNPPANRPGGNVRPSAGTPATLPDAIPVPSGNSSSIVPPSRPGNVSGGEPGIVMPPSGSGLRPGRK